MDRVFGIDVSKWQGSFDFASAKAEGAGFVIIRGAYGTSKDTMFDTNYDKAKAEGLSVGIYQYSVAKTTEEAVREAQFLYDNCLKGRQFELPIYMDVEDEVQKNLGRSALTEVVKAWCEYLENKEFWVGIYASKSFFGSYLNDEDLKTYVHWVAQWAKVCTYGNTDVLGMWQFGGETNLLHSNKVAGVTCDQDYMLADYPALIKNAGKNGYSAAAAVPSDDYKSLYEAAEKNIEALQAQIAAADKELSDANGKYAALVEKLKGLIA